MTGVSPGETSPAPSRADIEAALARTGGVLKPTARDLGVTPTELVALLRRHGLRTTVVPIRPAAGAAAPPRAPRSAAGVARAPAEPPRLAAPTAPDQAFELPAAAVRVPRYSQLEAPPVNDALKMNEWTHRALGIGLVQALHDPDLSEEDRRKSMCEIAARMAALTPVSRLARAEAVVRGEAAAIASSRGSGPQMETATHVTQGEVGTGDRRPAARRGRPRKYGLG